VLQLRPARGVGLPIPFWQSLMRFDRLIAVEALLGDGDLLIAVAAFWIRPSSGESSRNTPPSRGVLRAGVWGRQPPAPAGGRRFGRGGCMPRPCSAPGRRPGVPRLSSRAKRAKIFSVVSVSGVVVLYSSLQLTPIPLHDPIQECVDALLGEVVP